MLLVEVPAPELVVVLVVGVAPVHGLVPVADELRRGADHGAVARAQERCHRHALLRRVHHGPVPHALVRAVAQRL